ncbi:BZIP domain-containing protein [Entamoeba marina]
MEGNTTNHPDTSISQEDEMKLLSPPPTQQFSPYASFSPYIPQAVSFSSNQQPPQFPNVSNPQYGDPTFTPLHRRKRKFQNITYDKLLSEEDLASMTVEEFEDYVNELKDRRTITKAEKATLNKIKRKLKNKESARKSRQKSKEAFLGLQEQLQELRKQYDEVLRINCQLIEIADGCDRCRQRIRQVQPQRPQGMVDQQSQQLHLFP